EAVLLQDGSDVLRIGYRAFFGRRLDSADETTRRLCEWLAHRFACQKFLESNCQIPAGRLDAREANTILVIDAAPIANHLLVVEDKNLRGAHGSELIRHDIAYVLENRERDPAAFGILGDGRNRVLLIGVEAQESDFFRLEVSGQLGQTRTIELGYGTLATHEDDHDQFAVGDFA